MELKFSILELILIIFFWSISCVSIGYVIASTVSQGRVGNIENAQIHNHYYAEIQDKVSGFEAVRKTLKGGIKK